ncbi:MAG: hypothetical protein ABJB12_22725 [Pseudomonadota bacterium]
MTGAHWVGASLFALLGALALAACTESSGSAPAAADAGAGGAAGALQQSEGGAGAARVPVAYADAGAPGALPVCTTTLPSQCAVGEALVTSADRYCPYCRICARDEKNVCPPFACGSAAHNELAPGQCCSSCVPNDPALCASQQQAYVEQRQPIVDQYVALCTEDADCSSALLNTPCEQTCVATLRESAPAFVADLAALACPGCPLQPPVSLRPGGQCPPATCLNGLCMLGAWAEK